ncbi:hypothetical protein CPB84DRAFT_1758332 [Gymnopilus junonius]|uniref:Uncharacterized protein n=1 Tax=Gymnopilus junonius TaxID=109634 RepID=A0A9P5P3D8_GYMJU|nr:hypothetical protein CPB84DRAFT_1758332 [Gymnopilus junonius]
MAWAELYLFFGHLFRKLDLKVINTNIDDFRSFKDFFVPVYEGKPLHIVGTECI